MRKSTPEEKEQLQGMLDRHSAQETAEREFYASIKYAGFWRRFVAFLIDQIVLLVPSLVIGSAIGVIGEAETEVIDLASILIVLLSWLYYALMESSSKQATLGKMAIGIVVTDVNRDRISFGRATGRHFGKFISAMILGIGFIFAGFTKEKQAVHDMLAGCLVVMK